MGCLSFCRDCSCWCVFVLAMSILLLTLGLVINDVATAVELQQAADSVEGTPLAELACIEVCRNWFSEGKGEQCCDRVASGQCMEKEVCRRDFLSAKKVQINIMVSDISAQVAISVICLLSVLSIAYIQDRRANSTRDSDLDLRIQRYVKKILLESGGSLSQDITICSSLAEPREIKQCQQSQKSQSKHFISVDIEINSENIQSNIKNIQKQTI